MSNNLFFSIDGNLCIDQFILIIREMNRGYSITGARLKSINIFNSDFHRSFGFYFNPIRHDGNIKEPGIRHEGNHFMHFNRAFRRDYSFIKMLRIRKD